ncbi:hypothetical protein ERO13_D09G117001v2 [Gossypium hirsutum]|nr:hypothetical protein ERO13_D09G117001v2 [Gossypium hirsutum]KAG4130039.1 hypothetical protein ERO13_D09G117001v2 [Gossypium hirsutum]
MDKQNILRNWRGVRFGILPRGTSPWVGAHQLVPFSNLISTPLLMNLDQNQSQGWWLAMFRDRSSHSKQ